MHNQHAGLSQSLAEQRITERQEQAARVRLAHGGGRPRRRRRRWWLQPIYQQFLHCHAMAWSADHRPEPKEQQ